MLRGSVYREDGAISVSDIDDLGRYAMISDERSWHLLLVEQGTERVIGCARFLIHSPSPPYEDLLISHFETSQVTRCGEI